MPVCNRSMLLAVCTQWTCESTSMQGYLQQSLWWQHAVQEVFKFAAATLTSGSMLCRRSLKQPSAELHASFGAVSGLTYSAQVQLSALPGCAAPCVWQPRLQARPGAPYPAWRPPLMLMPAAAAGPAHTNASAGVVPGCICCKTFDKTMFCHHRLVAQHAEVRLDKIMHAYMQRRMQCAGLVDMLTHLGVCMRRAQGSGVVAIAALALCSSLVRLRLPSLCLQQEATSFQHMLVTHMFCCTLDCHMHVIRQPAPAPPKPLPTADFAWPSAWPSERRSVPITTPVVQLTTSLASDQGRASQHAQQ